MTRKTIYQKRSNTESWEDLERVRQFQKVFLQLYAIFQDCKPEERQALSDRLSDRTGVQDTAELVLEKLEDTDHQTAPMWVRAAVKSTIKKALMKRPARIQAEKEEEERVQKEHYGSQNNYGMF